MKLQLKEKVTLAVVLGFFGIIIIAALFIRFNRQGGKVDIPYSTSESQKLQNKIDEYYETTKEKSDDISSKTYKSGDLYTALIVSKKKSKIGDYEIPKFKAYYYNSKDDTEVTRKEVSEAYGLTEDMIYDKISNYFMILYKQEIEEGYVVKEECSFSYCYMMFYRDCPDFNNYVLYPEGDKLYAYISFDIDSIISDKEFFDKLDYDYYKIEIK